MISYDDRTALVVVDCQNDFADPEGSLYVDGAEEVMPWINRQVVSAVAAGAYVVYTQDWHPETTPHFQKDGGTWPVHCVKETWGADFHPRLLVVGPSVKKGSHGEDGYSGFTMRDPESGEEIPTRLDALLREQGAARAVVVGLAQDVCVKATSLDAIRLGYETILPTAGTAPVNLQPGDGEAALEEMKSAGVEVLAG